MLLLFFHCRLSSEEKLHHGGTWEKSDTPDVLPRRVAELNEIKTSLKKIKVPSPKNVFTVNVAAEQVEAASGSSATASCERREKKESEASAKPAERLQEADGAPLDDDGFESLNGNASSDNGDEGGEEEADVKEAGAGNASEIQEDYSCSWKGTLNQRTKGHEKCCLTRQSSVDKSGGGQQQLQTCLEEQETVSYSGGIFPYSWAKTADGAFNSSEDQPKPGNTNMIGFTLLLYFFIFICF